MRTRHAGFRFVARRRRFALDETGKKSRIVKLESGDGYDEEIRYFVDCVARGQKPEIVTARDAVTALEICEAEEKSVRTGRPVKI